MTDVLDRLGKALADRYAIEREIGSGGMATVYHAQDLKHERQVAIKVLRPELAAALGPERFLQEIKIAANLHHPHILPLYDSGEADGFLYYVMPYVEGESLRDRLEREKQLAIDDALQVAREVADALSYAHAHGVIHRDIKPENILLESGHAVVADFGIARAVDAAGGERLTETGLAIGTPAYMSPEQAGGEKDLDGRSDLYSLGCVLHEMLAGQPPFTGPTVESLVHQHLSAEPPSVTTIRPSVPGWIAAALERSLAKTPADRFNPVALFGEAISPRASIVASDSQPVMAAAGRRRWFVPSMLAAVTVVVLGVVLFRILVSGSMVLTVLDIQQVTLASGLEIQPAISPDGDWVAYTAESESGWHVFVNDLAGGTSHLLMAGRQGNRVTPRWRSDGQSITFFEEGGERGNGAYLIPRGGGPTRRILGHRIWDVWNSCLVFIRNDSLLTRAIDGGEETFVVWAPPEPHSVIWSPDGSRLAFVQGNAESMEVGAIGNVAPSAIWVVALDGNEPTQVTEDHTLNVSPAWMPDGEHLLYISNRGGARDIYAIRVDRAGRPQGESVRVTPGMNLHSITLSADGSKLAYSQFTIRQNIWEVEIPESGSISISEARQVTFGNQVIEAHGLSRDGSLLAFDSDREGPQGIYVMPVEGGEPTPVTRQTGINLHPDISPDGNEIVFYSGRHGTRDVFVISVDGTDEVQLTDGPGEDYHPSFSPDGLAIAFTRDAGVHVMERDSVGGEWSAPRLLTPAASDRFAAQFSPSASQLAHASVSARWSPDGQHIAYSSPSTNQIWIVSLDGEEWSLFDGGDVGLFTPEWPSWSPDGRVVYFTAGESAGVWSLHSISVDGGALREVVRFDDPTRRYMRLPMTVVPGKVYLTLTEFESDISVMDLEW